MLQEKEMTTLNPSVAADGEQSLSNHNNSITDDAPSVNEDSVNLENDEQYDFEAEQREMWKTMDPNYLKTVSMPELYDTVYPSRPPVIDGLLYPGTYILAGAPKLGKSFLMAQLAYHVSAGLPLWGYNVHMGLVLYLALEDDYGRLQKRLYQMFGVETSANLYLGTEAHILGMGLTDQLDGFVKEHSDTKLIIVDTLQKIRGDVNDKSYLHHEMDRGAKAAGVKRIRIHDPRLETRRVSNFFAERKNADGRIEDSSAAPGHSHVSLLIEMGFSAVAIADRLGHESIEITYRYLSLEVLNDVVQEFINQIVFLRICEDRNLPLYHKLQDMVGNPELLQTKLEELFREADHRYNSGMFSGDEIVFDLSSNVISDMISGLYYPQSPYMFNIIEPNLLGKIYELFLTEQLVCLADGKIGLTKKKECQNRAVVTTPTEIVKYMVDKTLRRVCRTCGPRWRKPCASSASC